MLSRCLIYPKLPKASAKAKIDPYNFSYTSYIGTTCEFSTADNPSTLLLNYCKKFALMLNIRNITIITIV